MGHISFTILFISTITFIYGIYRVGTDPLVSGVPWWGRYPGLVVLSLLLVVCLFYWRRIILQFRKDPASLGFSSDANGLTVFIVYIVVAILLAIVWGFS